MPGMWGHLHGAAAVPVPRCGRWASLTTGEGWFGFVCCLCLGLEIFWRCLLAFLGKFVCFFVGFCALFGGFGVVIYLFIYLFVYF